MSRAPVRLQIARLGAQGDGVADTERGPVHVAFALPGETVNAAVAGSRGELMAVIEPSPLRVEPRCRHFGVCGGCTVQHLEDVAYRDWKRSLVVDALRAAGVTADVDPLVPCLPHSRRRAALTARRTERGMLLGCNRARSNEIVDIEECPVLLDAIVERMPQLRRLAAQICATDQPFRLLATLTDSGLDVAAGGQGALTEKARRAAAALALEAGFARLSVEGGIVVESRKPSVVVAGAAVEPPPGGFLQAVAAAEETLAGLAVPHLARARRVADLFSGSGAFALRLARHAEVHAVEADAASLAALDRAFRFGTGLKRVSTEKRDLARRPLTAKELDAYGGVLFDPPRAGAEDQARQIARSAVPRIAAVSCNPGTLARDLRILLDGGYRLRSVTPVDQFLWSAHVEVVALLERPRKVR